MEYWQWQSHCSRHAHMFPTHRILSTCQVVLPLAPALALALLQIRQNHHLDWTCLDLTSLCKLNYIYANTFIHLSHLLLLWHHFLSFVLCFDFCLFVCLFVCLLVRWRSCCFIGVVSKWRYISKSPVLSMMLCWPINKVPTYHYWSSLI